MSEDIYQLFRSCTARLETKNDRGTGFFVAPGKILTCAHIVHQIPTQGIQISWQDKILQPISVDVNENLDLALLKVELTDHPCVYLDREATPGDYFYSYGYPESPEKRNGASIRVEYEGTADNEKVFTIKGENVRPGFSGAPLLNQRTLKVCALIKRERSLETGRVLRALGGYAIPLDKVLVGYPDLEQHNYEFHQQAQLTSSKESSLVSFSTQSRDSKQLSKHSKWTRLIESNLNAENQWDQTIIKENFRIASRIGRDSLRKIDGKTIRRTELKQIVRCISQGDRTILLTDRPGSGKTCVLLKLADLLERQSCPWNLLFIKGDYFSEADTEQDLAARGLPENIVGQCDYLAKFCRVVVIIDSLDVLSLGRHHAALKLFLSLIDRLESIDGVTVIAACRTFDLEYDPLLRGRSWQRRINLEPLNFEKVVSSFLLGWDIDPHDIHTELRQLLQIPQNLHLYEKLAKLRTGLQQPTSSYELCNSFLEEVVVKNSQLGSEALIALQNMARQLMQQRSQSYSKSAFNPGESIVRQLISQEVLLEPKASPGFLKFSHQTLADCLTVRANLAENKTLTEFILDYPQLPFIRPTVRAFFFFLRTQQPEVFSRQIRQVLSHNDIAYHVKRLICESLAEITPTEQDWSLLRWIFQNHSDLFRRLMWRLYGKNWFEILRHQWLTEAQLAQDREVWLLQFIQCLRVWMNQYPIDVVSLWRESITDHWASKPNLIRTIRSSLGDFQAWNTDGIRQLLETLIEESDTDQDLLGKSISKWVKANDSGDDLLWLYITKSVLPEDTQRWELRDKLRCSPDDFHEDNFLDERLTQSDDLLAFALSSLENWSNTDRDLVGFFLRGTSWRLRRSSSGIPHPVNSFTELLDGIENAFKHRSRLSDQWWRTNEPYLRNSQNRVIRYFIIQSYKQNIEDNLPGIEFQLQDEELFYDSDLKFELGELMKMVYPFISEAVQTANQEMILSWKPNENSNLDPHEEAWIRRTCCNYLLWIPAIFRSPEAQSFIDTWQHHFGNTHLSPYLYLQEVCNLPPLTPQQLLELSDNGLFRLLSYYKETPTSIPSYDDSGGYTSICAVLREACSLKPVRLLQLFPLLVEQFPYQDYIHAVIEGIAYHLRYRFGNLSPSQKWEPATPLPDGKLLAAELLALLERYPIIWKDCKIVSEALESCCDVLDDYESAERLTLLLFWLRARDTSVDGVLIDNSKNELYGKAINSAKGKASEAAITLCNKLLEKEQPLPELLSHLLSHFASDRVIFVRVPILQRLPSLLYKDPTLGWKLLADSFHEPQTKLWHYAEQCLYCQYQDNFHLVSPYLNRLLIEGIRECGDTWGRISTLASLAGHISQEEFFKSLETTNSDAWEGASQVFVANLHLREHTEACHKGLITILNYGSLTSAILRGIEDCFNKPENRGLIKHELALAFLETLSFLQNRLNLHNFLEWLGSEANRDPFSIFEVIEVLLNKLENESQVLEIWRTEPLISALNSILREADDSDDPQLIQRAINLQDRFLGLNIRGIEELLARASQN